MLVYLHSGPKNFKFSVLSKPTRSLALWFVDTNLWYHDQCLGHNSISVFGEAPSTAWSVWFL